MPLVAAALALSASTVAAEQPARQPLPEPDAAPGVRVPSVAEQAIEAPASVSASQGRQGLGLSAGDAKQVVTTSSTTGIPAAALAAYQRAESVINRADASCQLQWHLVAAIGRVESDHGRAQGNRLDANGVAKPGIFGVALTGKKGTRAIRDTDAGRFDNDTSWDRAVGPMQFIPGTWSAVGVDGDGDGLRDPQDVDDAALATAVYLCSGTDDLSKRDGQRAAVHRYNHSRAYVSLVISLMKAYLEGDFTQVPTSTLAAGSLSLMSGGPQVPPGGPRDVTAKGPGSRPHRFSFWADHGFTYTPDEADPKDVQEPANPEPPPQPPATPPTTPPPPPPPPPPPTGAGDEEPPPPPPSGEPETPTSAPEESSAPAPATALEQREPADAPLEGDEQQSGEEIPEAGATEEAALVEG